MQFETYVPGTHAGVVHVAQMVLVFKYAPEPHVKLHPDVQLYDPKGCVHATHLEFSVDPVRHVLL